LERKEVWMDRGRDEKVVKFSGCLLPVVRMEITLKG
jgi:hypothetical protein